jgi:hypothetical protein
MKRIRANHSNRERYLAEVAEAIKWGTWYDCD